jgi:hypothetical protein
VKFDISRCEPEYTGSAGAVGRELSSKAAISRVSASLRLRLRAH